MRNTSLNYKRESAVEKELKKLVEKHGGLCLKFVSPGNPGVPDRIVLFKDLMFFVETKAPKGTLGPLQKLQHKRFAKMGFDVIVLKTIEQAKTWVELSASIAEKACKS